MSDNARERTSVVFSGRDDRSFSAYHDLYASGTTVARLDGLRFGARLSAYRFPDLLVFDRHVSGASHHRDRSRVRRDGFEHINLQVLRSGRMVAGSPGHERRLKAGDIVLFDTAQPQRTLVEHADYVSVAITRSEVEAIVPSVSDLHGTILPSSGAGLLSDFLLTLGRHAGTIGQNMSDPATTLTGEMLAGLVKDGTAGASAQSATEQLDLHRWRAETFIKANLCDPLLSPDLIAAGIGISRTALFRAFAPMNGVVGRILALRLARLRRALLRLDDPRNVAEMAAACGFVGESTFYRAFKAAYGVTPGQMRAAAHHECDYRLPSDASGGWAEWWTDIA